MFRFLSKKISIHSKLTLLVFTAATFSALLVGWVAYFSAKRALTDEVLNHLNSIRVMRGKEIENYLKLYRRRYKH